MAMVKVKNYATHPVVLHVVDGAQHDGDSASDIVILPGRGETGPSLTEVNPDIWKRVIGKVELRDGKPKTATPIPVAAWLSKGTNGGITYK